LKRGQEVCERILTSTSCPDRILPAFLVKPSDDPTFDRINAAINDFEEHDDLSDEEDNTLKENSMGGPDFENKQSMFTASPQTNIWSWSSSQVEKLKFVVYAFFFEIHF
jgi:bacillopeptidase F (M6 metalloprotease family)